MTSSITKNPASNIEFNPRLQMARDETITDPLEIYDEVNDATMTPDKLKFIGVIAIVAGLALLAIAALVCSTHLGIGLGIAIAFMGVTLITGGVMALEAGKKNAETATKMRDVNIHAAAYRIEQMHAKHDELTFQPPRLRPVQKKETKQERMDRLERENASLRAAPTTRALAIPTTRALAM